MLIFNTQLLEDSHLSSIVFRWNIEFPKAGEPFNADNGSPLSLRGWAVATGENQEDLHVVLSYFDKTYSYQLNKDRPDVVKYFFNEDPQGKKHIRCGFDYPLDFSDAEAGFEIGFEVDGIIRKASQVCLRVP
jgi:hypothetical protein